MKEGVHILSEIFVVVNHSDNIVNKTLVDIEVGSLYLLMTTVVSDVLADWEVKKNELIKMIMKKEIVILSSPYQSIH